MLGRRNIGCFVFFFGFLFKCFMIEFHIGSSKQLMYIPLLLSFLINYLRAYGFPALFVISWHFKPRILSNLNVFATDIAVRLSDMRRQSPFAFLISSDILNTCRS